jgi:hypothetical protein
VNLRRCLWCLLPRARWVTARWNPEMAQAEAVRCGGSPAFRPAGRVLQHVESDYSFFANWSGNSRRLHDLRRLADGLRRLDERAAVNGWLCEGCEARGADFDPVGLVERGEVIL